MIADLAIHRDDAKNPHAHVLLHTPDQDPGLRTQGALVERAHRASRLAGSVGGGPNEHLARAGLRYGSITGPQGPGSRAEPGRKIGVARERQETPGLLPPRIADRVEEQQRIAHENGERCSPIRACLKALTRTRRPSPIMTIAKFLHTRTDGAEQFRAVHLKVTASRELVALGRDERGRMRYSSREMLKIEHEMLERAARMSAGASHGVGEPRQASALSQWLSPPSSAEPSRRSPRRAISRRSSASPAAARAVCWPPRARPGRPRAIASRARRSRVSPPRISPWRRASRRARSRATSGHGSATTMSLTLATCS